MLSTNGKKRTSSPREWSSQDHSFYKQCIRQACDISEIPSSLANHIAEIVRNTSIFKSDWKKIARCLGLNNESQLKAIEDAAGYKQELPLYIALTSQYMKNSAASLGALLNTLMNIERYDILIKIKEEVQEIVRECGRQGRTSSSTSLQNITKKQPIEEESIQLSSEYQNIAFQNTGMQNGKSETKFHYDQRSPPSSLLEILNKSDEATKKNSDDSVDYCHPSCEKDNVCMSNWKAKVQNNENFGANKKLIAKPDTKGITDFEYIKPSDKNQSLRSNVNISELNSGDYVFCHDEVAEERISIETNMPAACVDSGIMTYTESERSNNEYFDTVTEEYAGSDTSCDEDIVTSLYESFNTTDLCGQNIESSALSRDYDNRRIQKEKFQQLNIREYSKTEQTQCEDQSGRTHDKDNTVNERIENLVAVKDELVRNVEIAEERKSGFLALQPSNTIKKPQDNLLKFVSTILHDSSINLDRSIKVIVIHSQEDSDAAIDLAHALVKQFHMAAVAECELSAFWIMDYGHYRAALYWADIIIPLITNTWLQDITNEKPLSEREVPSLNARSVFRMLQNMFSNNGSVNLSSIPVVLEGTSRRFIDYVEIRDAIKLSRDFHMDNHMKKLGDIIQKFHIVTRDAKNKWLDNM